MTGAASGSSRARPAGAPTRTPWGTVAVFAAAGFFTQTTSIMTAGLLPAMAADFSVAEGAAGSLTSVFALAIVLTVLPGTRLSLRFTRRTVIVATVLMLIASNLIVAASPSLSIALVGRFIGGTAHGLLASTMPAIVMRIVPPPDTPKALGISLAGNSAGLAVGAPLTAVLATSIGWRASFAAAAGVGLLIAVALFLAVPHLRVRASRRASVWSTARTPGVMRMAISWAIVLVGHYAVFTFIAPVFLDLGGGETAIGLPLLILGSAGIVGVLLAGRLGIGRVLWGAVGASALVALSFMALWLHPPLGVVLVVLAIWGAGSAASLLLNQQCVLLAGHRSPELAMSMGLLITQFGIALGSALGGTALQVSGPASVPLVGAGAIAIALLLLIGMPGILRRAVAESAGPHAERAGAAR